MPKNPNKSTTHSAFTIQMKPVRHSEIAGQSWYVPKEKDGSFSVSSACLATLMDIRNQMGMIIGILQHPPYEHDLQNQYKSINNALMEHLIFPRLEKLNKKNKSKKVKKSNA